MTHPFPARRSSELVRLDLLRDRLAAAAEMQHGGRGNADLRRFRYHAGEEVVVGTLDWPGVADRRLDVHGRRAKADLAAVVPAEGGGELAVSDGDAVEAPRSEERRVGKEWVSPCRSRWSPEQ